MKPSWTPGFIDQYILEDEIELVQYGQSDEITFEKLRVASPEPSSWNEWPTKEKPKSNFKFNSLWLELGQNYFLVKR